MRAITDGSGNVTQTYQSDEFGIPTQTQGTSSQPFQYTGQRHDAETGLYFLRARMYDPSIGRFFSRDPLAGLAAAPQTLNRFTYVENNPVRSVDPSGLKPQAASPGSCLFQTVFGGFTLGSVFCPAPFQTSGKQRQKAGLGCPNSVANIRVGSAAGYDIQYRDPSTDNGKAPCHANAEIPVFGDPKDSYINWHIYFSPGVLTAEDTGIWGPGQLPDLGDDAFIAAAEIVGNMFARVVNHGGENALTGAEVDVFNRLLAGLKSALEELQKY